MEKIIVNLPAMYGDHHVIEVRRLILALDGVVDVQASSAFKVAEISFEPEIIQSEQIIGKLAEAGYLDEIPVPAELSAAAGQENERTTFFRHTVQYDQTKQVVSFAQNTGNVGRPLWPCPGMGPIKGMDED